MEWVQLRDGSFLAYSTRTHWYWSVIPYKPETDSWILRGRHHSWEDWRWFGAYQGLENVKSSAQREDTRDPSSPMFRRYPPGERCDPESEDEDDD